MTDEKIRDLVMSGQVRFCTDGESVYLWTNSSQFVNRNMNIAPITIWFQNNPDKAKAMAINWARAFAATLSTMDDDAAREHLRDQYEGLLRHSQLTAPYTPLPIHEMMIVYYMQGGGACVPSHV